MNGSIVTRHSVGLARLQRLAKELSGLEENPSDAQAWFGVGIDLHRLNQPEAALAAFEQAVALAPEVVDLWMAVASLRAELGRPVSALDACNEGLRIDSDAPQILQNAALLLQQMNDQQGALLLLNKALQHDPDNSSIRLAMARVLAALQRLDEAAILLNTCLEQDVDDADCLYALADVEVARWRFPESCELFRRLLILQPKHTGGRIGLAVALAAQGREEEAQVFLDEAYREDPVGCAKWKPFFGADMEYGRAKLDVQRFRVAIESAAIYSCNWFRREGFLTWLAGKCATDVPRPMDDPDTAFVALGLELGPVLRQRLAERVAQRLKKELKAVPVSCFTRRVPRNLRIGYLTGDLRQHPIGRLFSPIFSLHDRQRFEVFVYHTGPFEDCMPRHRAEQGSDVFRDVPRLPVPALAQLIAADGIDLLVDLSGYTMYGRTAALSFRPAPIQIAYMGFLGTLGASYVDYALVDRYSLLPEVRNYWTEAVAYLPKTFFLADDTLSPVTASPESQGRKLHGLPERGCILACLNSTWKIEPSIFSVWMQVLRAVPDSILWLFDGGSGNAQAALLAAAQSHGVFPERLVFAPRVPYEDYLCRYQHVDLVLNTCVYAGNTTTMEALAMGVPVLSVAGEEVQSRTAAGMLIAHGLPECVLDSLAEYEREAIRLASNPALLAKLKQKTLVCRSDSGLFSTKERVKEIERAFEMMWKRYSSGLPPADFDVPPVDG